MWLAYRLVPLLRTNLNYLIIGWYPKGALLSHMMEPIYLDSIVLASLFNYEHLVRAIHGRLNLNFDSNSLKGLPQRYGLHKSKVAKCQLREDITRQVLLLSH